MMCPRCKQNEINTSTGYCTQCRNAKASEYRKLHVSKIKAIAKKFRGNNPAKVYSWYKDWRNKNQDKVNKNTARYHKGTGKQRYQAVQAVNRAVRNKKLTKPDWCLLAPECLQQKVEAHHYKGYSKEYWLTVEWLCRVHHMEFHSRQRIEEVTSE